MSKKFVVCTETMTAEQEKSLRAFFEGTGWWHYLPNFWIVVDDKDRLTARAIRDQIKVINDGIETLVLEVEPVTWSGLQRKSERTAGSTPWLNKNWQPTKPKA